MAGTEVVVPFALDLTGQIATTTDPQAQSQEHVDSLVSTAPGERVMRPTYGIPLKKYMFWPGDDIVDQAISQAVRDQMAIWEPTLSVLQVTPVSSSEPGLAEVDVDWEVNSSAQAATLTATINVGGTVVAN